MGTELIATPLCPKNDAHGRCEFQKACTPEQAFVGARYQCRVCLSSVLFPSAVLASLAAQQQGGVK